MEATCKSHHNVVFFFCELNLISTRSKSFLATPRSRAQKSTSTLQNPSRNRAFTDSAKELRMLNIDRKTKLRDSFELGRWKELVTLLS